MRCLCENAAEGIGDKTASPELDACAFGAFEIDLCMGSIAVYLSSDEHRRARGRRD